MPSLNTYVGIKTKEVKRMDKAFKWSICVVLGVIVLINAWALVDMRVRVYGHTKYEMPVWEIDPTADVPFHEILPIIRENMRHIHWMDVVGVALVPDVPLAVLVLLGIGLVVVGIAYHVSAVRGFMCEIKRKCKHRKTEEAIKHAKKIMLSGYAKIGIGIFVFFVVDHYWGVLALAFHWIVYPYVNIIKTVLHVLLFVGAVLVISGAYTTYKASKIIRALS
jgi:hypothetical protein